MNRLGIIGGGAMGSAIINGLLNNGLVTCDQLFLYEIDLGKREALRQDLNIQVVDSLEKLAKECSVLLLAVKPQAVTHVLSELGSFIGVEHLLISIVAGNTLRYMEDFLAGTRVIRVMPNTPARFGKGISAYAPGKKATAADCSLAEQIFKAVGQVIRVNENQMDAVTATSGSGPAYLFYFAEAMIDAAVMLGLSRDQANLLVIETLGGAVEMLRESGEHPAKLRNDVTSPAGTTAAALYEFEKGALTGIVTDALLAAARRSTELGEELGKKQ